MTVSSPTVLVTGGAKRIGREISLFMARRGWNVAVHYNTSRADAEALVKEIRDLGRGAQAVQADLTDTAALHRLVPSVCEMMGHLQCLVNNASAFTKDTLGSFNEATWRKNMDTNLYAPMVLIREFAAQHQMSTPLSDGTSAQVINLVDGVHGWSVSPHFLTYALSKLGLQTATGLLARELAPGIRINAIAPGPTMEGKQDKQGTFEKLKEAAPLKRITDVEEICLAIDFLLSAPSVTGQTIQLSGGFHLMPQMENA